MNVYWLDQNEADVPLHNDWLGAREAIPLGTMRFAKRRSDWRLGRWAAKCALASHLQLTFEPKTLARLEIVAATSGAPDVFFDGRATSLTISLSHRAGRALCAVSCLPATVGCDLELIEPRSFAFVADYFSTEEQALVARACAADRHALIALLWSAKESALKALRTGLRLDTRSVIVRLDAVAPCERAARSNEDPTLALRRLFESPNCHALSVHRQSGEKFQGYWQRAGEFLRTIVADPPPHLPLLLHAPKNILEHPEADHATNTLASVCTF